MEYDRVQQFAAAYQVQEIFARVDTDTLNDYLQLESYVLYGFDPNKMNPQDAKAAIPDVRKTLAHVVALQDVGAGLKTAYEKALPGK